MVPTLPASDLPVKIHIGTSEGEPRQGRLPARAISRQWVVLALERDAPRLSSDLARLSDDSAPG
jgi:hypothetical protein